MRVCVQMRNLDKQKRQLAAIRYAAPSRWTSLKKADTHPDRTLQKTNFVGRINAQTHFSTSFRLVCFLHRPHNDRAKHKRTNLVSNQTHKSRTRQIFNKVLGLRTQIKSDIRKTTFKTMGDRWTNPKPGLATA